MESRTRKEKSWRRRRREEGLKKGEEERENKENKGRSKRRTEKGEFINLFLFFQNNEIMLKI
jgi:hypothetical protein